MSTHLSVTDVLSRLEAQLAFLREREAFHAQQEAFHGEERARFAAELADVARRFEAFKATSAEAVEVAVQPQAAAAGEAAREEDGPNLGGRPKLPRLVARVLEKVPETQHFGAGWLAAEINRRFGKRLRRPTSQRFVSVVLRRMAEKGQLVVYREGRSRLEARYMRKKTQGA